MSSPKTVLLILILMFSISFSVADVEEYLYGNETIDSVDNESFTYLSDSYEIFSLNGEEILLLKNGEVVENDSVIENVVYNYFLDEYYPSQEDAAEIRRLLDKYNESRNNGHKFPGNEEETCLGQIFINGRVETSGTPIRCRYEEDDELCRKAAMLMYQYLSSVSGAPPTASYLDLYEPIKEFGFASHEADVVLETIDEKFDEAEEDRGKMYDALEYAHNSIPTLENHVEVIENSMFGWTEEGTGDEDHWCLCPDMDLDESVLEEIEEKTENLMADMGPLGDFETVAENLKSNTRDRVAFAEEERTARKFKQQFEDIQSEGQKAISLGEDATSHIRHYLLSSKLDTLNSLDESIPSDIESREFEGLEDDIQSYEELSSEVENLSLKLLSQYNETFERKAEADALLLVLQSRQLDPYSKKDLEMLNNESEDLDAIFGEGMTFEQAEDLSASYSNLTSEGTLILENRGESPIYNAFLLFRGFATKVNTGIADFAVTSEVAEPKDVKENRLLAVGGFSFLVLISFGSVAFILFLSILVFRKFYLSRMRFVVMAAFFGCFSLILVFSGLLFMYLNETSADATIDEYLADFESRNSTAIIVDTRDSFYSQSMSSCADDLASTFQAKNKSVVIYTLSGNNCEKVELGGNKRTIDIQTCLDESENMQSVFLLNYSSEVEEPKFSTIYMNKADIRANSGYYNSCPLTAMFR